MMEQEIFVYLKRTVAQMVIKMMEEKLSNAFLIITAVMMDIKMMEEVMSAFLLIKTVIKVIKMMVVALYVF